MNEMTIQETVVEVVVEGGETVVVVDETAVTVELGTSGPQGGKGTPGVVGRDPYTLAVDNGFVGTEDEWLTSLAGAPGKDSTVPGPAGQSAFQLAEAAGFAGTETEWRVSLTGPEGPIGLTGQVNGILATVADPVLAGQRTRLTFDGETEPTIEGYRRLAGYAQPAAGDRVVLVNMGSELTIVDRIVMDYQIPQTGETEVVPPTAPWLTHNIGRYGDLTVTKTRHSEWVICSGVLVIPADNNTTPLFRLPGTHRPQRVVWALASISLTNPGGNVRALRVDTDGFVWGHGPATLWPQGGLVTLSDLVFNVSQTQVKTVTALNGPYGYGRDPYGMIWGLGAAASTTQSVVNTIVNLPAADRASVTVPIHAANVQTTAGLVTVSPTGTQSTSASSILSAQLSNSLTALYDPIRFTGVGESLVWSIPSLQNGWTKFDTNPMRYAKRPDGTVIIQGRISGGLPGAPAFVLPPGFLPAFEQVHPVGHGASAGSWTVTAGGSVIPLTSADVAFASCLHLATH